MPNIENLVDVIFILNPIHFTFSIEGYEKHQTIESTWNDPKNKLDKVLKYNVDVHPVTSE